MPFLSSGDLHSAREIALAAGVPEAQVVALMGGAPGLVRHGEAVRIGRTAVLQARRSVAPPASARGLFGIFSEAPAGIGSKRVLALSSTVHAGGLAVGVFIALFNLRPRGGSLKQGERPPGPTRL